MSFLTSKAISDLFTLDIQWFAKQLDEDIRSRLLPLQETCLTDPVKCGPANFGRNAVAAKNACRYFLSESMTNTIADGSFVEAVIPRHSGPVGRCEQGIMLTPEDSLHNLIRGVG